MFYLYLREIYTDRRLVVLLIFKVRRNNLSGHVYLFLTVFLIFKVGRNNLSGHVYIFLVVLLTFKVSRNNLSDHVYLILVILLIFNVGRNNLSDHVYIFHVVMTCYTSTCQHKTTRPCKHYRNILGVYRRFRELNTTETLPRYANIEWCNGTFKKVLVPGAQIS